MNILIVVAALIIIIFVINLAKNRGISSVNAERAKTMVTDSQVTLLDVRTPPEFSEGHILGARLIPVAELEERLNEIASLKDRPILVYCRTGNRSGMASRILRKNGFTKVTNLAGGILAWQNSGNATVRGN
ncbi:MAG: rhodanese-like domain-containing protein [Chitinivibrionales bacterium]|nr:rhodanese-like domain-containing protein [Chitinivibrionales bacterium]